MIECPRCGKNNQPHYKFCLGCGAELPRDSAQPKSFTAPTPPSGIPAGGGAAPAMAPTPAAPMPRPTSPPPAQPAPQPAPVAAAPAPDAKVPCPQCSNPVPANFKFCGSCGFDMTKAAPPAVSAPVVGSAPAASQGSGQLVLIRPDGTEGDRFPLSGTTTVGRDSNGPFAGDSYLSPQHAAFQFQSGGVGVTDLNSLNGVYIRIAHDVPTELVPGSIFRIGQEIIRLDTMAAPRSGADGAEIMGSANPGFLGRICLLIGRDTVGNCYPIPQTGLHLGRERGDVIFPDDGYVSGLHCRVHGEGGRMFLTDVGSSNGTFVRVQGTAMVPRGSLLLMGQQLFRVEY